MCNDDLEIRQLLPQIARPVLTYGFSPDADVRVSDFRQEATQTFFSIHYKQEFPLEIN